MHSICFPQTHGETAVTLFVHTGMSYDLGYQDVPDLAVQVDIIISGRRLTQCCEGFNDLS